jgi:hypothetical protein
LLAAGAYAKDDRGGRSSGSSSGGDSKYFYLGLNLAPNLSQSNSSIRALGGSFPNEGAATPSDIYGYDLRVTMGPLFWDHILLGFSYTYSQTITHRNSSPGGDTTRNEDLIQREFGPTMGFLFGGFLLKGTWIVWSEKVDNDDEANGNTSPAVSTIVQNYDGHGWEAELSYLIELNTTFLIGPSIAYRRVEYGLQSKTDNMTPGNSYGGKAFASKAVDGELKPMVVFAIKL